MVFGYEEQLVPLSVGVPPWRSLAPFVTGLAAQAGVVVTRDEIGELREALLAGSLHCALLPPLDIAHLPSLRVIPGVGVTARENAAIEIVTQGERHGGEEGDMVPAAAFLETARTVLSCADALLPQLETGFFLKIIPAGASFDFDAESSGLAALWRVHTGFPLVMLLCVCAYRAPYPRLRQLLGTALRCVEEVEAELPFSFSLGSDAVEGVRYLLKSAGYDAEGLVFC